MTEPVTIGDCTLHCADALALLATLPAGSVDAVICDPPYPCIKRPYGYWTEAEWFALMDPVVGECRRVLKPSGSAVFVLQPNSERVGRMRTWLWKFMLQWGERWGVVQDVWWWNDCAMPGGGEGNRRDLLRPSVKACCWFGRPDCYRDRAAVMIGVSEVSKRYNRAAGRYLRKSPGCHGIKSTEVSRRAAEGGEATPFNLLPFGNEKKAGVDGHPAGTPLALCSWWARYICPRGGTVLDPFMGSGTTGVAAVRLGRRFVGVERDAGYFEIARRRVEAAHADLGLYRDVPAVVAV